jgi:hypothetical protein
MDESCKLQIAQQVMHFATIALLFSRSKDELELKYTQYFQSFVAYEKV